VETNITPGGDARTRYRGRRGGRSWLKKTAAVGGALVVGAALLAVSSTAQGINNAKNGPLDARGFPTYFTDDSGISLAICEDGSPNCLGATTADLTDTTGGEAFYWVATAAVPSSRGTINVEFALEAAFSAPNVPMVFERLRVRGDLNRPGRYTLQHPYGSARIPADGTGPRNVNFTEDIPCNVGQVSTCSGPITSFLRSTAGPAGYIGSGEGLGRVTGGKLRNELVLRAPNGAVIGRTSQFAITGKVAPGPSAALSAESVDFGNTKAPRRRAVTVRNLGDAALNLNSVRVLGTNRITVAPAGCGASLAAGASCRVNLSYRPGAQRSVAGTLVINDNSIAATHRVPVRASTTGVASSARRVNFRATSVGRKSATRRVVVTNTGVVPMRIRGVSLSGGNVRSFERRSGQGPRCVKGARVRAGAACAIYVRFAPKNFGAKTTDLMVRSNTATSVRRIALNGRGR
jgi:hypothetical protein